MGAKAVVNAQTLAIYISPPESDQLLDDSFIIVPLYLGKYLTVDTDVYVSLNDKAIDVASEFIQSERRAIERVRKDTGMVKGDTRRRERKRSAKDAKK